MIKPKAALAAHGALKTDEVAGRRPAHRYGVVGHGPRTTMA